MDTHAVPAQHVQHLVGGAQSRFDQYRGGLTISLDQRVDHQSDHADEAERDDGVVSVQIDGTDGQVALQVPHPPFYVAMVFVDASHPIHIVGERLACLTALVGDQHPAAVKIGRFGDPVGTPLVCQAHRPVSNDKFDLYESAHVFELMRQVRQVSGYPFGVAVIAPFVEVVERPL